MIGEATLADGWQEIKVSTYKQNLFSLLFSFLFLPQMFMS